MSWLHCICYYNTSLHTTYHVPDWSLVQSKWSSLSLFHYPICCCITLILSIQILYIRINSAFFILLLLYIRWTLENTFLIEVFTTNLHQSFLVYVLMLNCSIFLFHDAWILERYYEYIFYTRIVNYGSLKLYFV